MLTLTLLVLTFLFENCSFRRGSTLTPLPLVLNGLRFDYGWQVEKQYGATIYIFLDAHSLAPFTALTIR